jgi:hypothetical protein
VRLRGRIGRFVEISSLVRFCHLPFVTSTPQITSMRLWEEELQKLGRILHAVGDEYVPDDIDKSLLWDELERCETHYLTSRQHRSNKILRSQRTQLAQLACTLDRLDWLLSQEQVRRVILPRLSPHEEFPLVAIDRLKKAVDGAVQGRPVGKITVNDRSPFEWLVGERLPQIFERNFKRPAGVMLKA